MIHIGDVFQYIPKKFWNSIEFAKKVFSSDITGEVLQYFSDEIRSNPEICEMTLLSGGFRYMDDSIRKNKSVILEMGDIFYISDAIDKELIEDEDILKLYWKNVSEFIFGDSTDLLCACSIVRSRQLWE